MLDLKEDLKLYANPSLLIKYILIMKIKLNLLQILIIIVAPKLINNKTKNFIKKLVIMI